MVAASRAASGPDTIRGSRNCPLAQPRRLASAYNASCRSWTAVLWLTATSAAPVSSACRANRGIWLPPAASPTTRNRSPWPAMTSSA
jgi:hypothetical protein